MTVGSRRGHRRRLYRESQEAHGSAHPQVRRREQHRHGADRLSRCSLATLFTFSNASSKAHISAHQRFWNAGSSELHATYSALPARACRRSVPPRPRSGAGRRPSLGPRSASSAIRARAAIRSRSAAWPTIACSVSPAFPCRARSASAIGAPPARSPSSPRKLEVDVLHGHGAKGGAYARLAARTAEAQRLEGEGHLHATWRQPALFPVKSHGPALHHGRAQAAAFDRRASVRKRVCRQSLCRAGRRAALSGTHRSATGFTATSSTSRCWPTTPSISSSSASSDI